MRNGTAVFLVALALAGCEPERPAAPARAARAAAPGPRIGMAELHRTGGVPPRWRFTVPPGDVPAGRRAFGDLGCPSCHAVGGEDFGGAAATGIGPDLTGMEATTPPSTSPSPS
jgi:hypothetical protein